MIFWNANFQIPNSSVQSANVFALCKNKSDNVIEVEHYSDEAMTNLLFTLEFEIVETVNNIEDYILDLDMYKQYERV